MSLLDNDETVTRTVLEHVNEEAIRLFITNQLPNNIVDNLIKETIDNMKKATKEELEELLPSKVALNFYNYLRSETDE